MATPKEQIPLITATPGTVEYQEQFEEQTQAAFVQFLRHPIVRIASAAFCIGYVAATIRELIVLQMPLLGLFNLTFSSGVMCVLFGHIALGRRTALLDRLLSATQGRIEKSDRLG